MVPLHTARVARGIRRRSVLVVALSGLLATFGLSLATTGSASVSPSGQVTLGTTTEACCVYPLLPDYTGGFPYFTGGGTTIEPAYNDANGSLVYLQTPTNAKVVLSHRVVQDPSDVAFPFPHPVNVAPLFLPVYPSTSTIDPSTLNCAHVPSDNCPDHGPLISWLVANAIDPTIYGSGVIGHDHLVGIASSSGDFNIVWEPVLVLFAPTDAGAAAAASQHITTLAQLTDDLNADLVFEVPVPADDFNCAPVSAAVYGKGTPAPPF